MKESGIGRGSLGEYRRKRDFSRTTEPVGVDEAEPAGIFVVQKHAARRLHYDFRLELDGVLLSWAIPKGPSLDPEEKRLAMHVEDHPLEYAQFEGIIPKGEYGGGTVMIWDRGRWQPEGDPRAGYRKGSLKFRLEGEKLKGGWALVRLRRTEEEEKESWLLVKEKDAEARPGDRAGIIERLTASAATGRSMEEIAVDRGAVWTGKGGGSEAPSDDVLAATGIQKGEMPDFIEPQHATLVEKPPVGEGWLHELKHDGYRLLCRIRGNETNLFTRRGNDWTSQFPTLAREAGRISVTEAWLDGEAVILREDGTSSFQELQNALGEGREEEIVYFVFDLLYLNGYDLRPLPLKTRKEFLKTLAGGLGGNIRFGDHWEGSGFDFFEQACTMKAEGMISKRSDSPYYSGRSRSWLKIKCKNLQEFVIGGYTEPTGGRSGFGALILGAYDAEGKFVFSGRVGTGFNDKILRELSPRLREIEQDASPFVNPPKGKPGKGIHWVRPVLVAEVEFSEVTDEGLLRHPSFQGLREDKSPREVVLEKAEPLRQGQFPSPVEQVAAVGDHYQHRGSITFAHIRFTNPDKVLYPEQGTTKLHLARYYHGIHERMLPHLAQRPLTLVRCPVGHGRNCFFQKHANQGVSHHIHRLPIRENEKIEDYMSVDDLSGLLSLVQMGVLEIHTWNSRGDRLEYPDRIVFDLDPDEGLPWENLAEGALLLRDRLLDLGLENFIKTTGGKGFHVVVPILPERDWEEIRGFAKEVAEGLARDYSERFTPKMTKARRAGRIFLDWMRNIRGATAIEAYSTRSRPGATVSVPISWEELATGISSDAFTIENLGERLERLERDPWEGYFEVRQRVAGSF